VTRGLAPAGALLAACLAAGCAGEASVAAAPPPAALYAAAAPPGLPAVRGWGDDLSSAQIEAAREAVQAALRTRWIAAGRPASGVAVETLALSGGGPDGAFAAGLLAGWTEAGDRPEFEIVTGVSVGALIAPFAFLGPDRDAELSRLMTGISTEDVLDFRFFGALVGALGVADPAPLRRRLDVVVDDAMLAEIARAHRRGRRLLVVTTNIDAARPVLWDMGALAEAGARQLFLDVLLASASIPGAFPPVPIVVEAGGERFVELHVDGGVTRSVAIGPTGLAEVLDITVPFPIRRRIFVIQNNTLAPPYRPVERTIRGIAGRTVSTLIRAQSAGDLTQIWLAAERAGAAFHLAFVPPGLGAASATDFDPETMRRLHDAAFAAARDGVEWLRAPPGVVGYAALAGAGSAP
jgi:predicted acylesterase/phospholipase RssA